MNGLTSMFSERCDGAVANGFAGAQCDGRSGPVVTSNLESNLDYVTENNFG